MNLDNVGVGIVDRNESERSIKCLASVKSDTRNIVYVGSGSTDDSIEVANQGGAFIAPLDLTKLLAADLARNVGLATPTALKPVCFVQFADGDCVFVPRWLTPLLIFIEQRGDNAVACGRRRELRPRASIYINSVISSGIRRSVKRQYAAETRS